MKQRATILLLILTSIGLQAQTIDTFLLHYPISKYDTIVYKRIIEKSDKNNLIHVQDYYPNGQIQMDAYYSNFDKNIKEELQCNYRTNTKQGKYKEWAKNGQLIYDANYKNGLRDGLAVSWYGYLINKLRNINNNVIYIREKDIGHWIHWNAYSGKELYDWLLKHDKTLKDNN